LTTKLKAIRHTILRRSGRPLLAVCSGAVQIRTALLAYDGSPKAKEALFMAAYLSQKHKLPLVVVTVIHHDPKEAEIQIEARKYLASHRVKAKYMVEKGPPAIVIQRIAEEKNIDLLIMGSYGFKPIFELVLGSTVDYLLAKGNRPILICR
jgi:nucleotide-binding universal stress UspA family protein